MEDRAGAAGFAALGTLGGWCSSLKGGKDGDRDESQEGHAGLSTGQWPGRNKQCVQSSSAKC